MTVHRMFRKIALFLFFLSSSYCYDLQRYPLTMPNVHPNVEELYLCTPVRVNYTKNYYIVGFEPLAKMNVVHHMLLYGCTEPGSSFSYWDCGEMANSDSYRPTLPPCKNGSQILYAWARDAPKLDLPPEVGFKVGGDSPIQYLVLQVHYAHIDSFRGVGSIDESDIFEVPKNGHGDNSGVNLLYTEMKMPKLAGVILLGTGGIIPSLSEEHMETSCRIREDKVLHPFAFRTHTHSLGKVVSGYRVSNDSGKNVWTLLGKKNPLLPQMFYPVDDSSVTIKKGDILAARCTMKSERFKPTYIGPTNLDEMCNFYLMYWVDGEPLNMKYCFSPGPPDYYWINNGLDNIPDREASSLE